MSPINQQLLSREASVTGLYSEMTEAEFPSSIDSTWTALDDVKKVIQEHVKKGNIRPIDGARGLAALTANILGYEEFVPRGNVSPASLFGSNQ